MPITLPLPDHNPLLSMGGFTPFGSYMLRMLVLKADSDGHPKTSSAFLFQPHRLGNHHGGMTPWHDTKMAGMSYFQEWTQRRIEC